MEHEKLSLRANFVWTLAGNVIYSGCQWGMLVAIAKLGTPVMVGQFALGLAISAPVFMLTNLQLRAVQATDARHEFRFGHYLALRLLGTGLALLAILTVSLAAGYQKETFVVILDVALAKAAESVSDVLYGLWQNRERLDKISIAMIGRGIASLTALTTIFYLTHEITYAVSALALVWGTWLLTYECSVARSLLRAEAQDPFRPEWQGDRLKTLATLSLPLGLVMLTISLNTNIPRYLLEHYHGEAALGYFAAMAYVLVAGTTVMDALCQSATPRFARYYLSDRVAFRWLLFKTLGVAIGLGLAGLGLVLLGGKLILALLYKPEYAQYASIFTLLMVAGCVNFLASALGYAFTSTRRFRAFVIPGVCNTSLGAIIGFLLIPAMGLRGAAFTVITISVGQLVFLSLLLWIALRKQPVSNEQASPSII